MYIHAFRFPNMRRPKIIFHEKGRTGGSGWVQGGMHIAAILLIEIVQFQTL